jgi:hypothetical protein
MRERQPVTPVGGLGARYIALGITPECLDIGDPIPRSEVGDVLADRNDLTGAFPGVKGKSGPGKAPVRR